MVSFALLAAASLLGALFRVLRTPPAPSLPKRRGDGPSFFCPLLFEPSSVSSKPFILRVSMVVSDSFDAMRDST